MRKRGFDSLIPCEYMKNLLNQEINPGDIIIDFKYGPVVTIVRELINPVTSWKTNNPRYVKIRGIKIWEQLRYVRDPDQSTTIMESTGVIFSENRTTTGIQSTLKLNDPSELLHYNYPYVLLNRVLQIKEELANGTYGKRKKKVKNDYN